MGNEQFRTLAGQTAGKYVAEHTGATGIIVNTINKV
jgi:hypothetical protein